jgi:hypothetical protein
VATVEELAQQERFPVGIPVEHFDFAPQPRPQGLQLATPRPPKGRALVPLLVD